MLYEIYYVNRFYPERGEMFYKAYLTREEAVEACRRANEYSHCHGCRYWIVETL